MENSDMRRSALPSPKKITSATAVADFLGIEVYEKASSHQVSVAIQKVIDNLKAEITLLRSANRLISSKNPEKAEQFGTVLEKAKALGIDLHQLDQQVKSLGISLHLNLDSNKDCADSSPDPNSAPTIQAGESHQDNPEWPTHSRSKSREIGAAAKGAKSSRRSRQKQGAAA
jgi:hypothetical protein